MKELRWIFFHLILLCNICCAGLLLISAYGIYIDPKSLPISSCFGLLFPIFLLANICFLFFWIIFHRKYLWPTLITLLLCFPQIRTYCPIHFQTATIPEDNIKILSYNVMPLTSQKENEHRDDLWEYLLNSKADIICMQEYSIKDVLDRKIKNDTLKNLTKTYPYIKILRVGKQGDHLSCLSKFPILSANMIDLGSDYNGSAIYKIKIDKDTITLINNHLESNKLTRKDKGMYNDLLGKLKDPTVHLAKTESHHLVHKLAEASVIRSKQVKEIARIIAKSQYKSIIVCGDFNDSSISFIHHTMLKNLNDAFTESGCGLGISYNQNRFYFRIDNIMASKDFKPYNCTIDHSIKVSDHYPIWCYLSKQ